jgi:hypothetical protein
MSTQRSNAGIRRRAAASVEAKLDEMSGAVVAASDSAEEALHEAGRSLRERAGLLIDATSRQARLYPLTTFAIALIAGVLASRALRR